MRFISYFQTHSKLLFRTVRILQNHPRVVTISIVDLDPEQTIEPSPNKPVEPSPEKELGPDPIPDPQEETIPEELIDEVLEKTPQKPRNMGTILIWT